MKLFGLRFVASKLALIVLLVGVTAIAAAAQATGCQPPVTDAGVYDFVPDASLQSGDFRPLLKSESAFIAKLRESETIDVNDYTTPVLPADIQPEPPPITGELSPLPATIPEPYFFTGKITKSEGGFLLDVQLKKSADGALLTEIKTPFAAADASETAGKTNAAAMIAFFATQAQAARDSRESGDHAIDPHIDLIVDKLRLKPNETSPVKIILTDCDGVRLKHRTIEASLQFTRGGALVQEDTLVRVTDDRGERNGDIGAHSPGVINYVAKFNYRDTMGVARTRTDTKTIVISGGNEANLWQMRVDVLSVRSTLYFSTDVESGRWSGRRYFLQKKASYLFVMKASDSDGSGEVATDEVKDYNGFGEVFYRDKTINAQASAELKTASGMLDQSTSAAENLQAAFSISPANNEFQASVNNIAFAGTEELFAVQRRPANYVHKTGIEYHEGMGAGGSSPITAEMKKSGVYTFTKFVRTPIEETDNNAIKRASTKGYEITQFNFEVRRLAPTPGGIIKR